MAEKLRKNRKFSSKLKAVWSKFLSFFKRQGEKEIKPLKTHSRFGALIAFQYRDKVELGWAKHVKTFIQKVVFFILKFVIIVVAVSVVLYVADFLFKISINILNFYLIFLGTYTLLNLFTVTFGLVKSLYYAEDNKVLVTFPVSSTTLFISKILVYILFEIRKAFDILIPVTLGFFIAAIRVDMLQVGAIFWSVIPFMLLIIGVVLFGALLSIPFLFIYKFVKNNEWMEGVVFILALGAIITGLVLVIGRIPEASGDIDLINQWPKIQRSVSDFIYEFSEKVKPITYVYKAIVGETGKTWVGHRILGLTIIKTLVVLAVDLGLFGLSILLIKPFYFSMLTKTGEFNKKIIKKDKKNLVFKKRFSFVVKEMKLTLRDFEISGSFIIVYSIAPVLLLFIDKVFNAMSTSASGSYMILAFNIVLIILPLLASSTIYASIFSKEGRAGYIKKTKPIKPYFPLISKMLFSLILVIPSIIWSIIIFVKFSEASVLDGVMLGISVLLFEYGHIFYSATLDVMNPQNELYATEGSSISNSNEIKSTVVGFLTAIFIGLISFINITNAYYLTGKYTKGFVVILLVGIAYFTSFVLLFFLKVKAFYIDRQEASRE